MSERKTTARVWRCEALPGRLDVDITELKHELPAPVRPGESDRGLALEILTRLFQATERRTPLASFRAYAVLHGLTHGQTLSSLSRKLKVSPAAVRKIANEINAALGVRVIE